MAKKSCRSISVVRVSSDWDQSHRVKITVPARDHYMLSEFNIGTWDEHWTASTKEKWLGQPELADDFVNHMNAGVGALKRRAT